MGLLCTVCGVRAPLMHSLKCGVCLASYAHQREHAEARLEAIIDSELEDAEVEEYIRDFQKRFGHG